MTKYQDPPPDRPGLVPAEYLTAQQVAELLGVSHKFVLNTFGTYPGVLDLSTYLVKRGKRRKRLLRIPKHVLEKFLYERRIRA